MGSKIKKLVTLVVAISILGWNTFAFAAQKHYVIRADGLACPYCAYGIEKKFMQISGVKNVDIDLEKGLVLVKGDESLILNAQQLKTLFNDAGFTFRKIEKVEIK